MVAGSFTVIDVLIDTLIARANALTGVGQALEHVLVIDGFGVSEDPGQVLMVGVDDPDSVTNANTADSTQSWHDTGMNAKRDEAGGITFCALSWNGNGPDGGQKQARDDVFAIARVMAGVCRGDLSLGIDNLLWTGYGTTVNFHQNQDEQGAVAWLIFRIEFHALV